MTVSSTVRTAGPYPGTGSPGPFPFSFKVFVPADLVVVRTNQDGSQSILALTADYTVTLNADQNEAPGGSVTLTAPLAVGYTLGITSGLEATQGARITNLGGFYPEVHEDALDKLTIVQQQQAEELGRALRVPEVFGVSPLPTAAQRAGKVLGFASDGSPVPVQMASGGAGELALLLADASDASNGAGMVGYSSVLAYPPGTVGYALKTGAGSTAYADTVNVYQRSDEEPSLPSAAAGINFLSGTITGLTEGWQQSVPDGDGPLYVLSQYVWSPTAEASLPANAWIGPRLLGGGTADPYVPDLTPPPTPTGLTVTAGMTTVFVEQDPAAYSVGRGPGRVNIYAAQITVGNPDPVFADAVVMAQPTGVPAYFAVSPGTQWRVWTTHVSLDGGESEVPAGPVDVVVDVLPEYLLELLTGEITETQLYDTLSGRIDLIDGPDSVVGTVNARIKSTREAIDAEISAINATLADLTSVGDYDPMQAYSIGDVVIYDSKLYRCVAAVTGTAPPNPTYWELIGDYASLSEAVTAHAVAISDLETRVTAAEGGLVAEVSARQTLASQVRGGYTGTDPNALAAGLIFNERGVRVAAEGAIASSVTTLQARVQSGDLSAFQPQLSWEFADSVEGWIPRPVADAGTVSHIAGGILRYSLLGAVTQGYIRRDLQVTDIRSDTNWIARARMRLVSGSAVTAMHFVAFTNVPTAGTQLGVASAPVSLSAGGDWVTVEWDVSAIPGWGTSPIHRIFIQAQPNALRVLDYDSIAIGSRGFGVSSAAVASLDQARADGDFALASSISLVAADVGANTAAIATEQTARVNGDNALASSISSLSTTVGANTAAIGAEATARVNGDNVLAGQIISVSTVANNAAAAVVTEATARATADGHLGAQYTVRVATTRDGRTVAGGFGISGTSVGTAGPVIDFGVIADRFWIGAPNSGPGSPTSILPFVVHTTATTINGVSVPVGVSMSAAFITNGTITTAKIGNLQVDDAKISSLNVAKLLAGAIAVGQYIEASNYVSGVSGWRFDGDGNGELNNVTVRGTVYASAGEFNGMLRVGSTPAISGTTMTGSGAVFNANGTWAAGNSTTNITFNGTVMTLNGAVVKESNLDLSSFTASITGGNWTASSLTNGVDQSTTRTAAPANGTAPYTYAWAVTYAATASGGTPSVTLSNINTATVGIAVKGLTNDACAAYIRCTVTDSNGRATPAGFAVNLSFGTPP